MTTDNINHTVSDTQNFHAYMNKLIWCVQCIDTISQSDLTTVSLNSSVVYWLMSYNKSRISLYYMGTHGAGHIEILGDYQFDKKGNKLH